MTTAPACTCTPRCGRTATRCSTTRPATAVCPTSPAGTSAASSSTPRRCWPSPTRRVNSYHRLVPGFEAPVNLVYSSRNRSAAMRIPITGSNPKAKRVEFRCPDPSSNPYLAFAALLLAGLDGIQNKTEPAGPDRQGPLRAAAGGARRRCRPSPTAWAACWTRLEADHDFLLAGRRLHPRPDRDLGRAEAGRHRRRPAAPAPARVRALLRRVIASLCALSVRLRRS